jgi:ABC-type amino acid transport system permease subunit
MDPKDEPGSMTDEDVRARRRGRMGLTPSWERIPWWGVIIMITGIILGYSMLTNTRYLDAIGFIFDLPWNRDQLGSSGITDEGEWDIQVIQPLDPGTYTIYAEYLDELSDVSGRSNRADIIVPEAAPERTLAAIPIGTIEVPLQVDSSVPSFRGSGAEGVRAILYYDFSDRPLLIIREMLFSNGVFLTIRVTLLSFAGALILGLIFGIMRTAPSSPDLKSGMALRLGVGAFVFVLLLILNPSLRTFGSGALVLIVVEAIAFLLPAMPYTVSTLYVEVIRGIPMLVIVLYMGFAITPALRNATGTWGFGEIDLRGLPAATIGLAFGYGAYLAEVYRAGIESIPRGQLEAARSLGMTYFQAMRHVILPQAIRLVLPPFGNDFIAMLKDTSLISVIALPEILQQGRLWISRNFRAFEGYNSVAMLYLIMTLLLSLLVRWIERRTAFEL